MCGLAEGLVTVWLRFLGLRRGGAVWKFFLEGLLILSSTTDTVVMKIVIVTAEPFGGYHLEPLDSLLGESVHDFYYLIPYRSPIQGNGLSGVQVVSDIDVIFDADRLVVTGGPYSAWTNAVALIAVGRGLEVIYSELAYVGDSVGSKSLSPIPARLASMSEESRFRVADAFGIEVGRVEIIGSPQLDFISSLQGERVYKDLAEANVLIVSSVGLPSVALADLAAAGEVLMELGAYVSVRTHPREDVNFWLDRGFSLSPRDIQVVDVLKSVDYAVASTGSFNPMLFVAGIPTVSLPQCNHAGAPAVYTRLTSEIADPMLVADSTVWEFARDKLVSELDLAVYLFGSAEGSAKRMVDFWVS